MNAVAEKRFLDKISGDEGGCWNWTSCMSGSGGTYPYFWLEGRTHRAHRIAFEHWKGPIPDGLTIDHLCRNRACVNPAHLEAVTMRENLMRGETQAARSAMRTHCVHGHEFTPENTRVYRGKRHCRACWNARMRAYKAQRKLRMAMRSGR